VSAGSPARLRRPGSMAGPRRPTQHRKWWANDLDLAFRRRRT
jgi:hypothetical protein